MKKRFLYLLLPIFTLILEILPYGAVCIFATESNETIRKTFSYFDLTPYGYANFAPFLTAITTCAILVLLVMNLFATSNRMIVIAKALLCVAVVLSVCPLLLGISFYSLVGALITLALIAQCILLLKTTKCPNMF